MGVAGEGRRVTATAVGIDVGTTNVKGALVRTDGQVVATASRPVATHRDGEVGEQDAEAVWSAVEAVLAELSATAPEAASQVVAVGCASQYSSIVAVDAAGDPVAPMVLWTDKRGTDHAWAILAEHDEAFATWVERHGIPPVGNGLALAHLLHLQRDRPEVHRRTAAWLEPMDFVNLRLTGRVAANQATMFMSQVCDNRALGAIAYDPELVAMAGLDADRLPQLVPVDAPVGTILPEVAARLGLPDGAVVYAGVNDTMAGAVATGAHLDCRGGLSIGTTSVLVDALPNKAEDLEHELLAMPSAFADSYVVMAENGIGGRALEHVLVDIVHAVDALGDHQTADEFARLDAALASVEPGSGGVLFLPWLNGSLSPESDPDVRGGFLNLSLDTGRTELVRATVEGLAHNLRWLLPHIEAFTGRRMDEIAFGGGVARSTEACQILADVLDRPVLPLEDPSTAIARAVAGLALHRHGALDRDELDRWAEAGGRYEPDPTHRDRYEAMHVQFEAAFHALRPIFGALNASD